jgi:hypothetical protein
VKRGEVREEGKNEGRDEGRGGEERMKGGVKGGEVREEGKNEGRDRGRGGEGGVKGGEGREEGNNEGRDRGRGYTLSCLKRVSTISQDSISVCMASSITKPTTFKLDRKERATVISSVFWILGG